MNGDMRPLFDAYPRLREGVPFVALGVFPTPVARMEHLEETLRSEMGDGRLYVKRDDLSGQPYGGNKVRKLEFLLGRAVREGRKAVLTFGAAGSNHALATAIYAKQLGLRSISMLTPQPNTLSVRRNLLMSHHVGAELHHSPSMKRVAVAAVCQLALHRVRDGAFPYVIPPGGSAPTGILGFVNAAFELKQQIADRVLPEPDCLYAASGTMGTVVGLLLGLRAAGLRTRVVAVRVTDERFTSLRKAGYLFDKTNALLHRADPSFPRFPFPSDKLQFRNEFYGPGYAVYTEEGMRAVRRIQETEGLRLEGVYTGKTFAAVLADAQAGLLRDQKVLFWNTYNSHDFRAEIEGLDYPLLPRAFHRYFEEEVQALERS